MDEPLRESAVSAAVRRTYEDHCRRFLAGMVAPPEMGCAQARLISGVMSLLTGGCRL